MFRPTPPRPASTGRRQVTRARRSFVPTPMDRSVLEVRQVLSTATLSAAGLLSITGTSGPDTINVVQSGTWIVTTGSWFLTSSVKSIVVDGQAGDDAISSNSPLPTTIYGGSGANTYPSVAATATIVDPIQTSGWAMSKAVLDKYQALGGNSNPAVGLPVSNEFAAAGGRVLRLTTSEIDYSPATGAHQVYGSIYQELLATANETDAYGSSVRTILGMATADESDTPGGRVSHFQGGDIDWSGLTGAHVVYGAILGELNATANETDANGTSVRTILGLPTADEATSSGGRVTHFQGGDIDYSATTGAHVVYGAILGEFRTTANETDLFGISVATDLGLPTSDEMTALGGRVVHFRGGDIYWSPATGAHFLYGPTLAEYNATANETDLNKHFVITDLGLPTSDEAPEAGGRVTHFTGGDIDFSSLYGAHAVYGFTRDAYAARGKDSGLLGFPTTEESAGSSGTRVQSFQGGTLNYLPGYGMQLGGNRSEMIAALNASKTDGKLDATEYSFFDYIANQSTFVDAITRDLLHKMIDGDQANAHYLGATVGNLLPGSPSWMVSDLEQKWFLGMDHPTDAWQKTNSDGSKTNFDGGTYQYLSGPLFGAGGPTYTDIYQGQVGDCYFLASLATTAARSPQTIRNMFTNNGDGTYVVRFFHNGASEYVTVDGSLPSGGAYYASTKAGPIWVALAEKAYIQINESGWLNNTIAGSNSYAAIDNGSDQVALNAINGQTATGGQTNPSSGTGPDLDAAWAAGKAMELYTTGKGYLTSLVSNHIYAVVGYNATTKLYTLFNPWGVDGGTEINPYTNKPDFKAGTLQMSSATINTLFYGSDETATASTMPNLTTTSTPVGLTTTSTSLATGTPSAPVIVPIALGEPATGPEVVASDTVAAVRVGAVHPRIARGVGIVRF